MLKAHTIFVFLVVLTISRPVMAQWISSANAAPVNPPQSQTGLYDPQAGANNTNRPTDQFGRPLAEFEPTAGYNPPRPGEYGHSMMGDIRQLNF
jgi:hypothetical protein